jgi:LmbE family N-acetylglucosaminyl deacetylase
VVERSAASTASTDRAVVDDGFSIDVTPALDRKVAALAAHRSQYAMEPGLLPRSLLERLLGTEHFVVASVGNG